MQQRWKEMQISIAEIALRKLPEKHIAAQLRSSKMMSSDEFASDSTPSYGNTV